MRSYLNPRAEIAAALAHFSVSPFPRLARAVGALAALLNELEQQALAHGRVRHVNFQFQAPRVRLRPHQTRVPERERVAGLEARGQTVHQVQGLLPEELRLDAP